MSLRRMGLERLDLFQLHRIDPYVPLADQIGEMRLLQEEGKVQHLGLSEVSVEELEAAQQVAPIATVQNRYNLGARTSEPLLEHAEANGIGFIPWAPLASSQLARTGGPLQQLAAERDVSPSQLALAWLLHRSPVMLPIPGTSKVAHLEDNMAAAEIELSADDMKALDALGR